MTEPRSEKQRMWRLAGRYSSVGIELAICIAVPVLIGNWCDNKFDLSPYGALFGAIVGVGACIQAIRRIIRSFKNENF
ncbi:MAG: AtpZ/AtpI family protein [Myxococcota bacterium]|nr:AtpZ/AtpI family protein [Myxococcota bacterium]